MPTINVVLYINDCLYNACVNQSLKRVMIEIPMKDMDNICIYKGISWMGLNEEGEKVKSKRGQELETYVQELSNCLNGSKSNSSLQK